MPLHRTQVLLEPEQHRELTRIARLERKSLSEVIREVVQRELERRQADNGARWDRRTRVVDEAWARYERDVAENGPAPKIETVPLLEDLRAEQDAKNLGIPFQFDR